MLIDAILAQAQAAPGKAALVHNGEVWTYARFARGIAQAQQALRTQASLAGGVAVLCIAHLGHAWVVGIAARRLGLATMVFDSVEALAGSPPGDVACVVSLEGQAHPLLDAWAVGRGVPHLHLSPASFVAEGTESVHIDSIPRPGWHIQLTSGTTGANKKIARDAFDEERALAGFARHYGIDNASVVYVRDFPLSTSGGFRWPLMAWLQGATVVLQQWRDYHRPHLQHRLTHAFATPSILSWLLHHHGPSLRRDDGLRLLVTGGAMPWALAAQARARLTAQVYTLLGSTEATTIALTRIDTPEDLRWHRVLPWREVQVVDEEGRVLPPGSTGRLRIRIDDDVAGYLDDEAASRVFFQGRYFYPGDLGVFDAGGRLALAGRVTEIINVAGAKIATAPLESALQDALGVDSVCLLSMPGADVAEDLHVVIQTRQPITRAKLEQIARGGLLGSFANVRFHLLEELPRNAMGKVMRMQLREQLLAREAGGTSARPGD
jgi:acyl-CoA synthetase (AMP-forming)/AMP-acid ligase II